MRDYRDDYIALLKKFNERLESGSMAVRESPPPPQLKHCKYQQEVLDFLSAQPPGVQECEAGKLAKRILWHSGFEGEDIEQAKKRMTDALRQFVISAQHPDGSYIFGGRFDGPNGAYLQAKTRAGKKVRSYTFRGPQIG